MNEQDVSAGILFFYRNSVILSKEVGFSPLSMIRRKKALAKAYGKFS